MVTGLYHISPSGVLYFSISSVYLRVTQAALPASNLILLTEAVDSILPTCSHRDGHPRTLNSLPPLATTQETTLPMFPYKPCENFFGIFTRSRISGSHMYVCFSRLNQARLLSRMAATGGPPSAVKNSMFFFSPHLFQALARSTFLIFC